MLLTPNAKINLGLEVVRRRADGYHDLNTIFLPVPGLYDELELTPATDLPEEQPYRFRQEGIVVDCPPDKNLIIKVLETMRQRFPGRIGGVDIRFRKNIPFGAGLGGGSADAAQMAVGLNELFALSLTAEELEDLVAPLGADCAFFVQNRPRYAEGIGNIFSEVPEALPEQLRGLWIVLLKPDCAVSTAAAYRGITPRESQQEKLESLESLAPLEQLESPEQQKSLREAACRPIEEWNRLIINDFEATVFPQFPEVAEAKKHLLDAGAAYASMSGSGATVFGLFTTRPDALLAHLPARYFTHAEQL